MQLHSLVTRLAVLLSFVSASANAQTSIFTTPSEPLDTPLVLNDGFTVSWDTELSTVDLFVFCTGGGNGPNGAELLKQNTTLQSYRWTVSKVQNCDIGNEFHFMVEEPGEGGGVNSAPFHVVANRSDLRSSTTSGSASPTSTATTSTTSANKTAPASSTETSETSNSPAADSNNNNDDDDDGKGLSVGLGVGLGVGLSILAILLGVLWYRRRQRARQSQFMGRLQSPSTPYGYGHDHEDQQQAAPVQYPADKSTNHELEATQVSGQEPYELAGIRQ